MKKVFLSLVFVAVSAMAFAQQWTSIGKSNPAGPEVKLVSSSEKQVVVDFTLGGFYMTKVSTPNGDQFVVSVPEMATSLEAGAPNLPHFPVPVLIGDLAEMSVKVSDGDFTDYNVEVAPSKGNISRQVDPKDVPYTYGEMYSQNAFYPAAQATLDAPYILRDFRGQNIVVRPFAYNPVTKTLRVYHHLTISMNKVSDNGENQKLNRKKGAVKMDSEMLQSYQRRFINFGQNEAKYTFVTDNGELLVICADQFMEGMQEFVAWKNQSGRPTTMVSVSEVGGNNDNTIKSYIQSVYNDPNRNLAFVLFVGDYEHITPHSVHSVSGERSDNWFGQLEGNDHYDEVMVGRFSVQTDAHVANHVNKVIYYERDMPEGLTWVNKGLGIGAIGAGSGHYGEDDYQHIDLIRDTLEHYTYEHVTELHGGGGASASTISSTINDGVSIINYCNHGNENGWAVANYSTSHVNALVNDYMWPINWSVACLTGKFNYGGANGECFAEAWMRATNNSTGAPTGAIGGMFPWMSLPWIPPMYGQDEMVNILCEWSNADKFSHTFGGASLNGNMFVIDMSGSSGYDTHDTWILFGDPTLMVRTDNPVSMNVGVNPAALMLGMSTLEITAENTPFGIATLMMDGEVISTAYIQDGAANLEFAPMTNVGNATLTVIGYNKVTEIINIEVLPAEGPYVTVSGYEPNFSAVNQETYLSMTFKNIGIDPTDDATTVTLSCADERLTLINSSAEFDVLPAEETVTLNNAFSFIVAEGVEDGERFQIDVEMNCGTMSWTGKAIITAGQAILDYAGVDWAGAFVPGETVTLVANFQNIGHYMATNAIASISCDNSYVSIVNESVEIGTIDPSGMAMCTFNIVIDAACPETEQILVNFTMTADGGLTAEGNVTMKNSCIVVFELSDSYGDGWNGNQLVISFSDGTPSQNLTLSSGNSETINIEFGKGVHVTLSWINGQYTYECSFCVKYEDGTLIYQSSNISSGQLFEFDVNCNGSAPIYVEPVNNLTAEIDGFQVILTWNVQAKDNATYIVYRNGLEIGRTTETTYTDEVHIEMVYTYCVVADIDGNLSVPSCVVIEFFDGIAEAQTTNLTSGWNWWSTYVEADDLFDQLKTGLGDNAQQIKSSTLFVNYFSGMWIGGLSSINNESCYLIKANNACAVEMTGNQATPADHPITINPNWNWIGYPNSGSMSVENAFSNITPTNGDQVKSQNSFSTYYSGMWVGGLNTITPGMGLLYKSNSTGAMTLIYPEPNRSEELTENVTNENNHWTADYHAYPSNMTVMAVIELDDVELSGENYEIAAFANGECRGSARLMYVEPIQRYVAFLTIVGDEASELRFSLYNDETGTVETQSIASLQYETNATIGSLETPYVIRFRSTTGVNEWASSVNVFPNPVNRGERFSLGLPAVETLRATSVQIINAMGVVVETVHAPSVQTVTAPNVAGVYTLKITMEGKGTCYRKLVVR